MTIRLLGYYPYFYPVLYIDEKPDHGFSAFAFRIIVSLRCFKYDSNKKFSAYGRYMESGKYKTYVYGVFSTFSCRYLVIYIGNAPKYSIDAVLSSQEQACFNYIFMPVFVIGLLSRFIYQPLIGKMALLWHKGELRSFLSMVVSRALL